MRSTVRRYRSATVVVALVVALGAAGCGGDDASSSDDDASSSDDVATDDTMDMDEHDEGAFAFGEPAEAGDADRTIEIEARDDLTFAPSSVEVAAGETVTFVVTNVGAAVHEFTLGDEHTQDEHEAEMQEMGGGMMHDEPNAVSLAAGETKELTWHFTDGGDVLFGCHQPGHYAGGMVGTVTVTE